MSEVMPEIPIYRVLRRSYINSQILEEGEQVEYSGKPGSALEPINEAAKLAKAGAVVIADAVPVVDERTELPLIDPPTPVVALTEQGVTVDSEAALQLLREEYEGLFGKKPHPATQEETLKTKIAEKRKELGFV